MAVDSAMSLQGHMDRINPFMSLLNDTKIATQEKPKKLPRRNWRDVKTELDEISTFLVDRLGHVLPLENAFFAGGCLRDLMTNQTPKDYDIYFFNPTDVERVKAYFRANPLNVEESSMNNFNLTLQYKGQPVVFQFITLMTGSPEATVNNFDFTMNMNFYVFSTEETRIHADVGDLRLHPGPTIIRPIHALCRITKFLGRGYTISHRELVELAEKAVGHTIPQATKDDQLMNLISGD
jgi:hypothetical protein